MSISFSGLASGLDTSTWVTSLTRLRQAKVTTLENQKTEIAAAQTTLQGIRSIFASFRASLEKITDSKFKVSNMDIFSKKIAEVTNAAVLSATAKSTAAEGNYAVKVNNIATRTQVKSGYRYKTTLVSTTQATTSSSFSNIGIGYGTNPETGITAGDIEIDHDDVTSRISISENETMSSFLGKLHAAGINAEFNNETGIFSIDVNVGDIRDIGNTNILSKLNISDINYGYTGEQLKIEGSHEEYHQATNETLLSDLGVSVGTISISTANGDYEVTLDENDTIGSLVSVLRSEGIEATFNDGVFSITNANITNDGTTGLIEHFGLSSSNIATQTQESEGLTYQTVYSQTTMAQLDSLLKDLDGVILDGNQTINVKDADGNSSIITVGTSTTINDMVGMMNDAGLSVSYNENTGVLSIDDGWIMSGGTFDVESAFGLQYTGVPAIVTGSALTVTTTTVTGATGATQLKDLSTAVTSGTIKVTDTTDTVHNLVINENSTINELVSQIRGLGLGAEFDNTTGVLTLTGGSYTTEGVPEGSASNFLNVFFGSDTLTPSAIDSATSTSQALRESSVTTHTAEGTTTLNQLGMANETYTATFATGATETEIEINGSMTMSGLVSALRSAGIDANFDAATSQLQLTDAEFVGVTGGNFDTIMNFAETITGRYVTSDSVTSQTVTIGKEMTSAGIVYHTIYNTSTVSTTVTETSPIVTTSGVLGYQSVVTTQTAGTEGISIEGTQITYTEYTSVPTIQTTGTLTYESISVTPSTTTTVGQTVTSSTIYTNVTNGVEQTSSLTYTTVNNVPGTTTTVGQTITGATIYTDVTIGATQTNDLAYTIVSTTNVGQTISSTIYTNVTTGISQTSTLTYTSSTETVTATGETTMAQLGLNQSGFIVNNTGNTVTIQTTDTINAVISKISSLGITASFNDGELTIGYESDANYLANISSNVSSVIGIDDGENISYSIQNGVTANASMTLAQLGMIGETGTIVTDFGTFTVSSTNTLQDVMGMLDGSYYTDWFSSVESTAGKLNGLSLEECTALHGGFITTVVTNTAEITVVNAADLEAALANYTTIGIGSSEALAELAKIVNGTDGYTANNCEGKTIVLTTDLDLASICAANTDGEGYGGWTAIGKSGAAFYGDFNGNGHSISGLYINKADENYQGLFGYVYAGTLKNVAVIDADVTGRSYTGGLVGYSSSYSRNTITNCYTTGSVTGNNYTGGLAGQAYNLQHSYATADVTGGDYTGGLAGQAYNSINIKNCYATGSVTGNNNTGGLFGAANGYTITNCYTTGSVTGNNNTGGLAGYSRIAIKNSYATGDVTGTHSTGGLVGKIYYNNSDYITNSYATGDVSGTTNVGGLVGQVSLSGSSMSWSNILSSGAVFGENNVGGLVGYINNTSSGNTFYTVSISNSAASLSSADATLIGGEGAGSTSYESGQMEGWLENIAVINAINTTLENGELTISPDGNHYLKSMSSNLELLFGINSGYGETYSSHITTETVTATNATTMSQLGLNQNGIIVNNAGNTVTVETTDTIASVVSKIGSLGVTAEFTDGTLTVGNSNDSNYITNISTDISAVLGIDEGEHDSYNVLNGVTADTSMTLAQLGMSGTSGVVVTDSGTYTVSATDTVQDAIDAIAGFDLPDWAGSIISDPTIAIAGTIDGVSLANVAAANNGFIGEVEIDTPEITVVNAADLESAISTYTTIGIGSAEALAELAALNNSGTDCYEKTFVLTTDLDLTSICAANTDGEGVGGWTAIGTEDYSFTGTFNGNGHSISGLYINKADENYQGLFGLATSDIKNVAVIDADVTGCDHTGALVGLSELYITNCYVTGNVTGNNYTGGLAGKATQGEVTNCYSAVNVTGEFRTGGLVGYTSVTVTNSYATGNVSGDSQVGGLVGNNGTGAGIINCYATGNVTGIDAYTGGLVGYASSSIRNSYATGDVTGEDYTGGLAGYAPTSIFGSHATGDVTGGEYTGGLAGWTNGSTMKCYAAGDVTGNNYTGGLVGYSSNNISLSYAAGNVSGTNWVGGLVGEIMKTYGPISSRLAFALGRVTGDDKVGSFIGGIVLTNPQGVTNGTMNIQDAAARPGELMIGFEGQSDGTAIESGQMEGWLANLSAIGQAIPVTFENGQLTITQSEGHYLKSMTSNLESILGINTGYNETYSINIEDPYTTTETVTATGATTMAKLGLNQNGVIVNNSGNIVTINTTDTISSVVSKINSLGITSSFSNGSLTVGNSNDTSYITNISSGVASILGIDAGEGSSYSVTGNTTADASMTLAQLGMSGSTGTIVTDMGTITVSATDTLGYLMDAIQYEVIEEKYTTSAIAGTIEGVKLEDLAAANNGFIKKFNIDRPEITVVNAADLASAISRNTTIGIGSSEALAELAKIVNGTDGYTADNCSDKTFVLTTDLDLTSICAANTDREGYGGWTAIGNDERNAFCGTFDGNGHKITGLYANNESGDAGLFGYVGRGCTIMELGLDEVNVKATDNAGALVTGVADNARDGIVIIENCYTTGTVIGGYSAGGLVGTYGVDRSRLSISHCYSECDIVANKDAGGLVGMVSGDLVVGNCYTTGNINGYGSAGGIAAYCEGSSVITNSYTTGNIHSTAGDAAGITPNNGSLTDCFATGLVTYGDKIFNASIENGQVTIAPTGNHYLKSVSSNLETILGINSGYGESYNVNITESSTETITVTATRVTTFAQLGLTEDGEIVTKMGATVTVHTTDTIQNFIDTISSEPRISIGMGEPGRMTFTFGPGNCIESMSQNLQDLFGFENSYVINGTVQTAATTATAMSTLGMTGDGYITTNNGTITVSASDTIGNVIDLLDTAGLTATIDASGTFSVEGAPDTWIESITPSLAEALGINAGYGVSFQNVGVVTETTTVTATTATTLGTLGLSQDGTIVTNNGNITISSSMTIDDLLTELSTNNITAGYNSETGVLSLGNGEDTNYIKAMSSNLSSVLGNISVGEDFSYSVGSHIDEEEVVTPSNETVGLSQTFGEIGITQESVLTLSDGSTVTVNSATTFAEFIGDMSDAGMNVSLVNGIFNIESGTPYITGYTGDNILNAMNIVGSTYQVTDLNLGNTQLKDLKDSLGNSLGITSGAITAYKNGIANNIYIDNTSTLDELASQLSNYNIQMVYGSGGNGRIYFTSSGDSYLSAAPEGSNILEALNIEDWTQVKNTASESLNYTTGSDIVITGDTKLVNLKNSEGVSLGITEGKYKLVAAGINYEGTITASTSVDDFFTELSRYGITGSINSNGQITINTANDDTYLVKANGADGYSNLVDEVFQSWTFGNIYESGAMDVTKTSSSRITRDTRIGDIDGANQGQDIIRIKNAQTNEVVGSIVVKNTNTVGEFMDALSMYGFTSSVDNNGRLTIRNDGEHAFERIFGQLNVCELFGLDTSAWEEPGYYTGSAQTATTYNTVLEAATRSTTLANLRDAEGNELGITTGDYIIHSNGISHTVTLSSTDITLDSFMNTLENYSINTIFDTSDGQSILKIVGSGDSYVESLTGGGASNVVEKLFSNEGPSTLYNYSGYQQTTELVSTTVIATLGTSLSDYGNSEGIFALTVDGNYSEINITSYDTFGSLIEKFERAGVNASLIDGVLRLETGNRSFVVDNEHTTSNLLSNLGLNFSDNLGGFAASSDSVTQTTTTIEDRTLSVAKYADYDTQLSLLNISSGSLSVYRNGAKKIINVDNTETFNDLRTKLQTAFGDIDIDFDNGKLRFFSTTDNVDVQVGSSNDSSNMSSICGFSQDPDGYVISARELYKVNASSKITTEGLFRQGDVTEGTFIVGDDTFTITSDSTIQNIIAQINSSEKANASAYWDSVDGKLVISARTTGASMVNIEAGTSNFTDILGLTASDWNPDGSVNVTRIRLDSQELGQNAKFSINGTNFSSASNVVTSDVSRIQGLTINLKSASMGETVTISVGKDTEAVSEAVGQFVESYNELVENVDAELSANGALKDQSTLKFIKQQIRSLLVNTFAGATTFRNLAAIGISTSAGNTVGIDTSDAGIEFLHFDIEKFMEGYQKDPDAVKNMLVGSDETPGILIQIENIVEDALATNTGYFSSADKSYSNKISTINEKIRKANQAIEAYRARLEAKFQSMDMLISQMQKQYSSFLSQGVTSANTANTSFYGL